MPLTIATNLDLKIESVSLTPVNLSPLIATQPNDKGKEKKRVLIVEDNLTAQKTVQIMLTSMSCEVDVASSGMDALMLCKNNHYDLILMDIGLGAGIDGYDVTYHIRKNQDINSEVPIIALTAHGGDENKQRCIEAGMNAVLSKPLTREQALDLLQTFVMGKKALSAEATPKARRDLPDSDEEMFDLDQFALFDCEQALQSRGNLTDLLEVLSIMRTDLPTQLERMKKAFYEKDYPTIEKTAHQIKGGAVYVHTNRMKYACQYLERYWKTGETALMDKLYIQAVKTIQETYDHVNDWLKKHQI
ncbi:MAG: response regulator [Tatlockia sp.]|nr:response regulator [Tatlockia sp.]